MWLKCSLYKLFFSLLPTIFFQLPITRTFFDFPWRFELSGVNCTKYFINIARVTQQRLVASKLNLRQRLACSWELHYNTWCVFPCFQCTLCRLICITSQFNREVRGFRDRWFWSFSLKRKVSSVYIMPIKFVEREVRIRHIADQNLFTV